MADLLLPVAVAGATIALAALGDESGLGVSWSAVAFVAVTAAVAATTTLALLSLGVRSADPLRSGVPSAMSAYVRLAADVVVGDRELQSLENAIDCEEIWIVSPDLNKDAGDDDSFRSIVARNVERRGIRYSFIVPETPGITARIRDLHRPSRVEDADRVQIVRLASDQWQRLPYTAGDIAIYNPTRRPVETTTSVFFQYPRPARNLWVQVTGQVAAEWIGLIELVVPELGRELN